MPVFIRIALAVDLLLVAAERTRLNKGDVLPVGGEPLIQLAILLCASIGIREIYACYKRSRGK
jgi:hypothetical protein